MKPESMLLQPKYLNGCKGNCYNMEIMFKEKRSCKTESIINAEM